MPNTRYQVDLSLRTEFGRISHDLVVEVLPSCLASGSSDDQLLRMRSKGAMA